MFKNKRPQIASIQEKLTDIPSGMCVSSEAGFYYVKNNMRHRIPTQRILASWDFPNIIYVKDKAIQHMPIVSKLGFRDGTFVQCYSTGRKYVVANSLLREVKDPDFAAKFQAAGMKEPMMVSEKDLEYNKRGEDII